MYIITTGMNPNEDHICHYGVKGMRWGVHRYRNPDGSLTDKAKKKLHNIEKSKLRSAVHKRRLKEQLDYDNRNHLINAYSKSKAGDVKGEKKELKQISANERIRAALKDGTIKAGRDFMTVHKPVSTYLDQSIKSVWTYTGKDYIYGTLFNSDKIADKETVQYHYTPSTSTMDPGYSDRMARYASFVKAKKHYGLTGRSKAD